jgi:copper chaperone
MTTEKINIENLKCHGCANTITRGVSVLEGVTNVQVNIEDSSISFDYDESKQNKENIVKKLARLGYPEKGKNSLKSSAVSYVSCAIGRVKK